MNGDRNDNPAGSVRSGGALINEVFICDASAEADRLQASLRAKHYPVIDVPPGLIAIRIRYEHPLAVILDADLKDSERIIQEIRDASGGVTHVVLIGESGRALDSPSFSGSAARLRYYRPIDVEAVLADLIGLLGPPQQREARSRAPRAPVLMAATRRPVRVDSLGTIPPPRTTPPETEGPNRYVPSLPPMQDDPGERLGSIRSRPSPTGRPRFDSSPGGLSSETKAVLEQGRRRVRQAKGAPSPLMRLGPTTDAEVPSDSPLLQALTRPLAELFGELEPGEGSGSDAPEPPEAEATRAGLSFDELRSEPATAVAKELIDLEDRTNPGPRGSGAPERQELALPEVLAPERFTESSLLDVELQGPDTSGPKTVPRGRQRDGVPIEENLSTSETPIAGLARGIRERFTGALAQQSGGGLRRVFLREGDIHSLLSSSDEDALVPYLERQGRLTPETARSLGALPHTARSAGASLVANGHLTRDELLPTLRAHAEWLLGLILLTKSDVVRETLPTEKTADDASIFGGTTGAQVYVEAIQRIRTPAEAIERFGSGETWITLGSRTDLFAEAQLDDELGVFEKARPLEFLRPLADDDPARLVRLSALFDLGALTTGLSFEETSFESTAALPTYRPGRQNSLPPSGTPFREQLEARLRLVHEADYFMFFGLDPSATGIEIERAHERIAREFSTENTPLEAAERTTELRLIRRTIEEAHRILGNASRRARYARALARNAKRDHA